MTFWDIERAAKTYYPAIALDTLFPRKMQSRLLWWCVGGIFFFGIFALPAIFSSVGQTLSETSSLHILAKLAEGLLFIMLSLAAIVFMLHAFHNSYYFRGFSTMLKERFTAGDPRISYEIATFCFGSDLADITESFMRFSYARMILLRAGVNLAELDAYSRERTSRLPAEQFTITPVSADGVIRIFDLALSVFRQDQEFADFLFKRGVQEKNLIEASQWVSRDVITYKKHARWYSRDRLGRIEGLAKDWSYGTAFRLRRYARELTQQEFPPLSAKPRYIQEDVERLEGVLAKTRQANALLVGEDGGGKVEVLHGLASIIHDGSAFPQLEHKLMYELDASRLVAATGDKTKFEYEFIKMLDEAVHSGNVILVIDDFSAFMQSVEKIGSNAVELLSPYFDSAYIQFICLSSPVPFHEAIEPNSILMQKFDTLILKEGEAFDLMYALQAEASALEGRRGVAIPQPTLSLIAESADRYITEGVMPDKALDLLNEIAESVASQSRKSITRDDVMAFIKTKTGIPTGVVSGAEQQKLVNLEKILHERVIGQDEAVTAIANAMRRARAGVSGPNRPLGSFLFMGPTGVGKTETTKALAQAFFNDDNRILRLDMSEYRSSDSLSKLIGSFQRNTPGVLTSMLREHPYGVLLLDEFEKTTKDVMNLFLQVLDEGFFSDMRGKKVNARNLIVVATSNAGSDLIWDYVKAGGALKDKKNEIIESVIKQGIFKPELLNRFDGVILFEPIDERNLRDIARIMLERLRTRLRPRGIDLEVTDEMISYLIKFGTDPKFGARPMNRAIQDIVEQKIADKIIKGEVKQGEKIRLTEADLGS